MALALVTDTMDDLLPTALVNVSRGLRVTQCRAILDTASTKNFMVEEIVAFLGLHKQLCNVPISTLNDAQTAAQHRVSATIESRSGHYRKTLDFLVVPTIVSHTPDVLITRDRINIPANIQMADPAFRKPAAAQILFGVGTTLDSLCVGQIKISSPQEPELFLQKTRFGWVVGGSLPTYSRGTAGAKNFLVNGRDDISRFWELEEIATSNRLSAEETACEDHFLATIKRDEDGRYMAALPFNDRRENLGESYSSALRRLTSLERRFRKQPELETQYRAAMREYIDLAYVSRVDSDDVKGYFIPHQAVLKQTSQTTKLRIVFDASAASSTGISLNDALLAGPVLQDTIFALLLRFRIHRYVLTGDIEKMYLQIKIRDEDRPYLRMLWRETDGSLNTYQFNRLIFGLKPASYIATRCLHRLADDERSQYPQAADVLSRDLYVDDLLTGADTTAELANLHQHLTALLHKGGFNLRQCASNDGAVLQVIPDRNVNLQLQSSDEATLKTLGIHWNSSNDFITYTVKPTVNVKATKRIIFSEAAKIYDPLGLLNPVVVNAKLIIQELWKIKVDWDESLPVVIHQRWESFISELPILNDISFDRRVLQGEAKDVELHGFCDASERAYGACIYLSSLDRQGVRRANLLCAKSRVAPLKTPQTIPRLELCAALLLADLYTSVKSSISIELRRSTFWTDSMIAYHWINTAPHRLNCFVANRVTQIQTLTNMEDWRHVRTHENPADVLSRGVTAEALKKDATWRHGPKWLAGGEADWPSRPPVAHGNLPEERKTICLAARRADEGLLLRYSSFTRLKRIVALCRRFLIGNNNKGMITTDELRTASDVILKITQKCTFGEEYESLRRGRMVGAKSKLLTLNPFIDENGLIRVGGRLRRSELAYAIKHPVVLPKAHHITDMIIEKAHIDCLHGGVQMTLAAIRQHYWPIDGRSQVKKILRKCIRCKRANPPGVEYLMGDLPKTRALAARPFTHTGVDYCGPFLVKERKLRNRNKVKTYVAVFVCFATKAVHLEVVSDLSTEAFLAALKRFIARRGKCASIASDNATNFVGANNEFEELQRLLTSKEHNERVQQHLADQGVKWNFIPPRAPHCGGLWEAAVKAFKRHLKRVVGIELFTAEQFNTLVVEIEAIMNSRPLVPLSSDPHDLEALTPAHFLIGDSLLGLPETDLSGIVTNRLSAWQHIQKVKCDFWKRWQREYVQELNVRRKWAKGTHSIREGSVVLIRDDNAPPMQWRMGRIIEVHPGQDDIIRTVRLRTASGELLRNVKGLAPLLVDGMADDSEEVRENAEVREIE